MKLKCSKIIALPGDGKNTIYIRLADAYFIAKETSKIIKYCITNKLLEKKMEKQKISKTATDLQQEWRALTQNKIGYRKNFKFRFLHI